MNPSLKALNILVVLTIAAAVSACQYQEPELFVGEWTLGGKTVSPEVLNHGQEQYMLYCYACHGEKGDGRGPASKGLRPPPRDFRTASFKFAKTLDGLPHDEDLKHIVRGGLGGTAMLPWDIPETALNDIVQYIKTFSPPEEGFLDPDAELGERVLPTEDPWGADKVDVAIKRGGDLYHGYQCYSCHAAYETKQKIADANMAIKKTSVTTFRANLYRSEPKPSETYTVPVRGRPCNTEADCGDEERNPIEGRVCVMKQCQNACKENSDCGDGQVCRFGLCELKLRIVPPDFTMDPIRAGSDIPEVYRTIAAGIPGSGMPQWRGSVDDQDIWAVAYYVNWLTKMRGTPRAVQLKRELISQEGSAVVVTEAAPELPAAATPTAEPAAPVTPTTNDSALDE